MGFGFLLRLDHLVEDFGFPFVKTDLVLRNPLGLADALDWRLLLLADGRATDVLVSSHLATMQVAPRPEPAA